MKHDEKKKRFRKQRPVKSDGPITKAAPTLVEFWAELQRAKAANRPLPAAPHAAGGDSKQDDPVVCASGGFHSSESFRSSGSGSGGAGYGLALIAPNLESQERIRKIMQLLCEKDAKRKL